MCVVEGAARDWTSVPSHTVSRRRKRGMRRNLASIFLPAVSIKLIEQYMFVRPGEPNQFMKIIATDAAACVYIHHIYLHISLQSLLPQHMALLSAPTHR